MKWNFSGVWNTTLELEKNQRVLEPRQKIWASELGGAYIDRFLKMTGVQPTNPPNARSRRKFEAGNMMEWLVGLILKRVGILKENQKWLSYQYPDLLPVSGRFDFLAGGAPDLEKTQAEIKSLGLPEFFSMATEAIVKHILTTYKTLDDVILEIKSCSGFMFDVYERKGANKNHALQLFHYLKSTKMPEGHIVYISKDDLRILQFALEVSDNSFEQAYKHDIETMTEYLKSNTQPQKENFVVFDEDFGKFSKNWKIGYSSYLKMLYGYENQKAYEDFWEPKAQQFTRVLRRVVKSKTDPKVKITEKNKEVIKEIEQYHDFEQCVKIVSTIKTDDLETIIDE